MGVLAVAVEKGQKTLVVSTLGTPVSLVGDLLPVVRSVRGSITEPVRTVDASTEKRRAVRSLAEKIKARGLMIMPLRHGDAVLGILCVARPTPWLCTKEATLRRLAGFAAIAIDHARLQADVQPDAAPPAVAAITPAPAGKNGAAAAEASAKREPAPERMKPGGPRVRLSPREQQILALLVEGNTYKEVASVLGISPRTVEHYVERLKIRFDKPRVPALTGYLASRKLI
jgi:DNA-binding CsgD family transcriptional regulator